MQISLLLMEEIVKLFAIMLMGYVVVKAGLMKSSESKSISLSIYSLNPLISLMRDKIILQLQLIMPGSLSITLCRKSSISSLDDATACT